jgi:hypothetical protein
MKQQLLLFFVITLTNVTAAEMAQQLQIAQHVATDATQAQKNITQTQQIFSEIAATKYLLEHKIREQLTGCSEQIYFDSTTGDLHQEIRNSIGCYDVIFHADGSIEIDTKYKKEKAPIMQDLNSFWSKRLKSDRYSTCNRSNSAYPALCKTTLTKKEFDAHMQAAEQAQPKLDVLG